MNKVKHLYRVKSPYVIRKIIFRMKIVIIMKLAQLKFPLG